MWVSFHFHKWVHTKTNYKDEIIERLALPIRLIIRECFICNKKQYEDKHCLGLNPPQYVSNWINMEKFDG